MFNGVTATLAEPLPPASKGFSKPVLSNKKKYLPAAG